MTRRERMERIINHFGADWWPLEAKTAIWAYGLSVLTDAAVEGLASKIVGDYRWTQENNRRNRAIIAANAARAKLAA